MTQPYPLVRAASATRTATAAALDRSVVVDWALDVVDHQNVRHVTTLAIKLSALYSAPALSSQRATV